MPDKIGEVIEASTGQFVAECYELHSPPPLGSLVKTSDGDVEIYGVVCNAATESIEPGPPSHRPWQRRGHRRGYLSSASAAFQAAAHHLRYPGHRTQRRGTARCAPTLPAAPPIPRAQLRLPLRNGRGAPIHSIARFPSHLAGHQGRSGGRDSFRLPAAGELRPRRQARLSGKSRQGTRRPAERRPQPAQCHPEED